MRQETIDITVEKKKSYRSSYTGGLLMIGLGILFLAHNFGYPFPANWWAFFVAVPALPYLKRAAVLVSRGDWNGALQPLSSSLLFIFLAAALILELDWHRIWPFFLILIGISSIVSVRIRNSN